VAVSFIGGGNRSTSLASSNFSEHIGKFNLIRKSIKDFEGKQLLYDF
jgi:hypothetical protein